MNTISAILINKADFIKHLNDYLSDIDHNLYGNIMDIIYIGHNGYAFTYTKVYESGHMSDTRVFHSQENKYFKYVNN